MQTRRKVPARARFGAPRLSRRERARHEGRRRAARVGVVALAATGVGLGVAAWPRFQSHPAWVAAPASPGPPVGFGTVPATYRVTYRVDSGFPLGSVVSTEVLEVQRPFRSRLTTLNGRPPGHGVSEVQTSNLAGLEEASTGQKASVLVPPPDLAAADLRLDVDLRALVAAGAVQVRERRTIGGRLCQVYRTTTPPQGQTIGPLPSASGDVTDSCVDGSGFILEQLQWYKGRLILRRRATTVDAHPTLSAHALDLDAAPTVPLDQGGGQVVQIDPAASQPGTTYYLDHPPTGYQYQGRYAVAEPALPDNSGLPTQNRRAGFVDVWVDGPDVILLDQGGYLYGGQPFGSNPLGHDADLGPVGRGTAVPGARLSQVYVTLPNSRYVRLAGTLPVDQLADLARTLRRVDRPTPAS